MKWKLNFLSEENFIRHVEATIEKYSGFHHLMGDISNENEAMLKRIYEYAKKMKGE